MGADQKIGRIIIITGLSGSGKSTALNALEDSGFFCIDNLPVLFLPKFLAIHGEFNPEILRLGVVMDVREKTFVQHFPEVFSQVQSQNYDLSIIFFEASDETLVKRFSETRRPHPLAGEQGLLEGIRKEKELMSPVREAAHEVVDTSSYNVHQLRELIRSKFAHVDYDLRMSIELLSFGFKNGLPSEADIVMDVRFLPNPYYLDELRELDGRDERIIKYVISGQESEKFLNEWCDLLEFMIPLYMREGKSYLTIAVGCTGGQHRSVTVVNEMARRLERKTFNISVRHRELIERRLGS